MDVFNQNWTNRMKTEPFVNQILNDFYLSTEIEPGRIKWRTIKKVKDPTKKNGVSYKYKNYNNILTNERFTKAKREDLRWPGSMKAVFDKQYIISRSVKVKPEIKRLWYTPQHMWANTRPQSLYNLNYATLR